MAVGVLACLAVGAGLEHARLRLAAPAAEAEGAPAVAETAAAPRGELDSAALRNANDALRAANEELRRRVARLEQAPKPEARAAAEPDAPREERREDEERGRRQSFTERMERFKQENPEEYAEMQKRRDEFRQQMEQRARDRTDFLTGLDTRNMSAEQRENHERLLAAVTRVNELMAQMGEPGAERGSDTRRQIGEAFQELGELYGQERRYLLEETGRAVGYEGGQAAEFADHIQTILDNTSMMPGFGRRGGPGGGGPPGPDGGR